MFFTFSLPQIRILARHGKKWTRTNVISLSFHTLFFPFSPSTNPNFGDLGKKWGWAPSFRIHFFLSPNPNFETLWEKMVLGPNRTGCISICDCLCIWADHTRMRFDGSGSKRYVTNICCSKMLNHSNRHAH